MRCEQKLVGSPRAHVFTLHSTKRPTILQYVMQPPVFSWTKINPILQSFHNNEKGERTVPHRLQESIIQGCLVRQAPGHQLPPSENKEKRGKSLNLPAQSNDRSQIRARLPSSLESRFSSSVRPRGSLSTRGRQTRCCVGWNKSQKTS
jgi:hypothetical protein